MLKDEGDRASRCGIAWELVMIEIAVFGFVPMPDVDDVSVWVAQIRFGRFAPLDLDGALREQYAASEEFVFVGAARMGEDGFGHDGEKEATVGRSQGTASGNRFLQFDPYWAIFLACQKNGKVTIFLAASFCSGCFFVLGVALEGGVVVAGTVRCLK